MTLWAWIQVIDWLENHGDVFLKKNTSIGRSLQRSKALQKSHQHFETVAKVSLRNFLDITCTFFVQFLFLFIIQYIILLFRIPSPMLTSFYQLLMSLPTQESVTQRRFTARPRSYSREWATSWQPWSGVRPPFKWPSISTHMFMR